jgi:archaellum biogenesis ATPase FlaH
MTSKLIITPVEKIQREVNSNLKLLQRSIGIYVSLNKTQKSIEQNLEAEGIAYSKIFFIDCVTSEKTKEEVLHISPSNLDDLFFTIKSFNENIPGEKFLILDALSTLLIYNSENKVAAFVKELVNLSPDKLRILAFSPKTKGEELLEKIFNFFDEVKN